MSLKVSPTGHLKQSDSTFVDSDRIPMPLPYLRMDWSYFSVAAFSVFIKLLLWKRSGHSNASPYFKPELLYGKISAAYISIVSGSLRIFQYLRPLLTTVHSVSSDAAAHVTFFWLQSNCCNQVQALYISFAISLPAAPIEAHDGIVWSSIRTSFNLSLSYTNSRH